MQRGGAAYNAAVWRIEWRCSARRRAGSAPGRVTRPRGRRRATYRKRLYIAQRRGAGRCAAAHCASGSRACWPATASTSGAFTRCPALVVRVRTRAHARAHNHAHMRAQGGHSAALIAGCTARANSRQRRCARALAFAGTVGLIAGCGCVLLRAVAGWAGPKRPRRYWRGWVLPSPPHRWRQPTLRLVGGEPRGPCMGPASGRLTGFPLRVATLGLDLESMAAPSQPTGWMWVESGM